MDNRFDWDALQSFLAVARSGRLTEAARRLGIEHSTLSRRISSLELHLRTKLFDRRSRGYTLTAQGEKLLESARQIESLALNAAAEIADSSIRAAGTVRVGAPDGFGTMFLARRFGKLAAAHPDLSLQVVTMPRLFSLTKREADLAIALARPKGGRHHARKLTDYELGLYASVEYLAGCPPIRDRNDLKPCRFIGYVEDLIYAPELDYLPIVAPDLHPSLTYSSVIAQRVATAAGQGICVLPCFLAGDDPALVRVLKAEVSLIRSFWLVVHEDIRTLARVRVVMEYIAKEVAEARPLFLPER